MILNSGTALLCGVKPVFYATCYT